MALPFFPAFFDSAAAAVEEPAQWILYTLKPKKMVNTNPARALASVALNDDDNVVNASSAAESKPMTGRSVWNKEVKRGREKRVGRKVLNAGWFVAIPYTAAVLDPI